jgi:phospholipid N-methyltransferase
MNSKLLFLSNFIKKPKEVASISPSSKHVIKHIIKYIDFENTNTIVEYGPGIGNITSILLHNLKEDAKLICFETNKKFCNFLRNKIHDPKLLIVNDSAQNLDLHLKNLKIKNIDFAVSGIPFSLINVKDKKEIIRKTKECLRKKGKFIVYQNSQHVKKYLSSYFTKISGEFEVRNMPPTFIFACEKI